MIIGERLRQLRERKKLTQGDIEERTGLMKCYISRVENGHTVPSLETLERFAAALELPLYQIFYLGEQAADLPKPDSEEDLERAAHGGHSSEDSFILKLGGLINRIPKHGRDVLLLLARKMARR
jgi:transcriptional regulator with XRE-family HTH domain